MLNWLSLTLFVPLTVLFFWRFCYEIHISMAAKTNLSFWCHMKLLYILLVCVPLFILAMISFSILHLNRAWFWKYNGLWTGSWEVQACQVTSWVPLSGPEIFKNYSESICLFCICRPTHSQQCLLLQPPLLISPQWNLLVVTGNAVQQPSSSDCILPFTRSFNWSRCVFSSLNQKSVVGTSESASLYFYKSSSYCLAGVA